MTDNKIGFEMNRRNKIVLPFIAFWLVSFIMYAITAFNDIEILLPTNVWLIFMIGLSCTTAFLDLRKKSTLQDSGRVKE